MPSHAYVLKAPIDEYLSVLEKERAGRTIHDYRYLLMNAVNALDAKGLETNPRKIGTEEIDFLRYEHYAHLNPTTNRRSIGIISTFLEWHENPVVRKMRIQWPQDMRINVDWLEENQAKAMIEVAEGQERMLVHFELGVGMRRCEVQRLRPQDIVGGVFQIRGKGRGCGKWRTVPFRPDTIKVIKPFLQNRERIVSMALRKKPGQQVPDALMIYAQYGWKLGAYQETAIDKMIKGVAARAGIDPSCCSNHTLRRTCGRMLFHAAVPIATISKILGHEDIRTTILYLGLNIDDMNSAWSQLDAYLKKRE